jgi:hypothetical protein
MGLEVRSDAQLFLLLVGGELVAKPVAAVGPEEAAELPEILAEDAATIIRNAAERADEGEISAHSVVDGLSASWEDLRSARFRIWDRHRD